MLRPFCKPCCRLLHVVACCCPKFKTGQTFKPTTPNISFVPWSPKRSGKMLDPLLGPRTRQDGCRIQVYKVLWVVSFPRCTAGPNIAGSCCICLDTTANTDATTPSIVGPTTLRVVAQILKPLKLLNQQLPTFLLFCDLRSLVQQSRSHLCWELLHPFARTNRFCLFFYFQVYDVVSNVPPVSFDLRLKR